jgi:hypothetical protein
MGNRDRQVEIMLPRLRVKGFWLQCLVTLGFLALVPTVADVGMPSGLFTASLSVPSPK